MDLSQRQTGDRPPPALGDLARLGDVRTELVEIEALQWQADDLTAALRARLARRTFGSSGHSAMRSSAARWPMGCSEIGG